jgi:aspartate 1-decarboxylase
LFFRAVALPVFSRSLIRPKSLTFASVMLIQVMKSKIHRVRVTEADLNYIGSITIDENLMDAANLQENEKVQVVNINNGERLETYVITGARGSGVICLNGPAARKVAVGDIVIVIGYGLMEQEAAKSFRPAVVFPDEATNQIRS